MDENILLAINIIILILLLLVAHSLFYEVRAKNKVEELIDAEEKNIELVKTGEGNKSYADEYDNLYGAKKEARKILLLGPYGGWQGIDRTYNRRRHHH